MAHPEQPDSESSSTPWADPTVSAPALSGDTGYAYAAGNPYEPGVPVAGYTITPPAVNAGFGQINPHDLLVTPPGAGFGAWFGRTTALIRRNFGALTAIGVLLLMAPAALLQGTGLFALGLGADGHFATPLGFGLPRGGGSAAASYLVRAVSLVC